MKTKERCKEGDFSCILFLFKTTLAAANIIAEIMNGDIRELIPKKHWIQKKNLL